MSILKITEWTLLHYKVIDCKDTCIQTHTNTNLHTYTPTHTYTHTYIPGNVYSTRHFCLGVSVGSFSCTPFWAPPPKTRSPRQACYSGRLQAAGAAAVQCPVCVCVCVYIHVLGMQWLAAGNGKRVRQRRDALCVCVCVCVCIYTRI